MRPSTPSHWHGDRRHQLAGGSPAATGCKLGVSTSSRPCYQRVNWRNARNGIGTTRDIWSRFAPPPACTKRTHRYDLRTATPSPSPRVAPRRRRLVAERDGESVVVPPQRARPASSVGGDVTGTNLRGAAVAVDPRRVARAAVAL